MKCVICNMGDTRPGTDTVTLQRGECTVIIKGVPAEICDNCGEPFFSDPVSSQLLEWAERAVKNGVEVEILRYTA